MKPLNGVKIIDFSQGHGASLATAILADFGAEVIKIENTASPDPAKNWAPVKNGGSAYYTYLNRGKKSAALDLGKEEAKNIVRTMIKGADVVCENLDYGVMEAMGFDYDLLRKDNPGLIYASLLPFGKTGPLKTKRAMDIQIEAMSGIMDVTGFKDSKPIKAGTPFGYHVGATYLAMAIVLALINKEKTGCGQRVDISNVDALYTLLPIESFLQTYTPENVQWPPRYANYTPSICPYDTFEAKDGYVTIAFSTDAQFFKFCDVFGLDEIKSDPRYASNLSRSNNYEDSLRPAMAAVFAKMSKDDIIRMLEGARLVCSVVNTIDEAMDNEQLAVRNMLVDVNDKAVGKIKIPGTVIKMEGTPGSISAGAPVTGEDTAACMEEAGFTAEQVKAFADRKIIETN
jgi:CoA:oxalate CoA-transferase